MEKEENKSLKVWGVFIETKVRYSKSMNLGASGFCSSVHKWLKTKQWDEHTVRTGRAKEVLEEHQDYVVSERNLSNTVKLSVFHWSFTEILTYSHDNLLLDTDQMISTESASGRDMVLAKGLWSNA